MADKKTEQLDRVTFMGGVIEPPPGLGGASDPRRIAWEKAIMRRLGSLANDPYPIATRVGMRSSPRYRVARELYEPRPPGYTGIGGMPVHQYGRYEEEQSRQEEMARIEDKRVRDEQIAIRDRELEILKADQ